MTLSLKWVFGFNKEATGGVHNLSDEDREVCSSLQVRSAVSNLNSVHLLSICSHWNYL
jgi:hypothetical protein